MIAGYARVSTDKQSTDTQRHMILDYAHKNKLNVDFITEIIVSSRKDKKYREIDETIFKLKEGDTLIVYSLDRIGRSTIETLTLIQEIKQRGIKLVFIRDNIIIDPLNTNPMNEMMLTLLAGFAQMERTFISERVKAGLKRVKENGTKLGRKKGQQVKSIYDEHKDKIIELKSLGVTNKRIQQYINIGTQQSLGKYIRTRKIV